MKNITTIASQSTRLSAVNILLIDADRELSMVLKKVLRSFGFGTVHNAKDGTGAIDILRKNPIDLVITDWDMQPMSGIEFIEYIRNNDNSPNQMIPIIMLTGRAKRTHVQKARDTGITEFLVKPFTAQTLRDRIVLVIEHPRDFVITPHYKGPDRRRRAVEVNEASDRREHDVAHIPAREKESRRHEVDDKDVFIIDADFSLREKIGLDVSVEQLLSTESVRDAQQIITHTRDDFLSWVVEDLRHLEEAYTHITVAGHSEDDIRLITHNALKIKGRAGTFGYYLASEIADSLHEICFDVTYIDTKHQQVIRKHIDALYVIFHRNIQGNGGIIGRDLMEGLTLLSERYKTVD